ncbi:hypothetical protein AB0B10_25740 [Micromonospora arborensis]|uniref:hypothetical protein n=1 Tax=Micromonospora arborensis TaxID=2116518 RepID=UPI0033E2D479
MTESTLNARPLAERPGDVAGAVQQPARERQGAELDVIEALYRVVEDSELGPLDDLMVRARVMWRCTRPERRWTCGYMNRADAQTCGGCGGTRILTAGNAASPGAEATG